MSLVADLTRQAETPEVEGGTRPYAFVQPFSLLSNSGGAQILRTAISPRASQCLSIRTGCGPYTHDSHRVLDLLQVWAPGRPWMGRLERGRLGAIFQGWYLLQLERLADHLAGLFRQYKTSVVHLLPHGDGTFQAGYRAARRCGLPVVLSMHDDLRYTIGRGWGKKRCLTMLGEVWRAVDHRFVVCRQMGEEYERRYGAANWSIHTDAAPLNAEPAPPSRHPRLIYFAGMMHYGYRENIQWFATAFAEAASGLRPEQVRFRLRCGGLPTEIQPLPELVEVLPFASHAVVQQEIAEADLLYLPLSFHPADADMNRFSFSTKLISYLASGKPIIYHGPRDAAIARYLEENAAAWLLHTNDPGELKTKLSQLVGPGGRQILSEVARNATNAAHRDFEGGNMVENFWAVLDRLTPKLKALSSATA